MTLIYKYIFAHTKEITRRKTHLKIHSKAFSQKSDPLQYAAVQYDLLFIYEQTNSNSASGVSVFMATETITLGFYAHIFQNNACTIQTIFWAIKIKSPQCSV